MSDVPQFLTVRQLAAKYPAFPVGGLRFHIFNAHRNGLEKSGALIRLGRKLLLDEARFLAWVASHAKRAA